MSALEIRPLAVLPLRGFGGDGADAVATERIARLKRQKRHQD
jgi:hypothetical protein